ncbi:GMC oxidoreductase [Okeania sp. SIO2B3]|uniref:GMC oxidoreductase n=1 Tax=Okeania sp. SIO2B3 TaxID=2607784 RepID=UPI0013BFD7B3|nr:GMC oxidoreductase [Okeania sp. SIO2B3]NET46340.1 hypothetical protein [Okeania sp. SIO2B3]
MPDNTIETDILIIGSGPIGATFARRIREKYSDKKITIVDAGPQRSAKPGEHLKNAYLYQKDRTNFSDMVRAELYPLSIPTQNVELPNLDPSAFWASAFVRNNMNPYQDPNKNMPSALAAFVLGGMGIHWTCATPRYDDTELGRLKGEISNLESYYEQAESYFKTNRDAFKESSRGRKIKEVLNGIYSNLQPDKEVQELPVAATRRSDKQAFIHWTGPADIYGERLQLERAAYSDNFKLLPNSIVKKLVHSNGRIDHAEVQCFDPWETTIIEADIFIVAASAIKTPQLLYASGIYNDPSGPLGRYLNEHVMTFTQVVLSKKIVEELEAPHPLPKYFYDFLELYHVLNEKDEPVPIPLDDPDPTLWIPVQKDRPWHCQIHKDNFSYGKLSDDVDDRLVVDLRWFGFVYPHYHNRVEFQTAEEKGISDIHGLPQPTFDFEYVRDDEGGYDRTWQDPPSPSEQRQKMHEMMEDMTKAALAIGGILPDSPPQFLEAGSSLHTMGTYRMGTDENKSVVDLNSKVWNFDNLYLGGPGVIPTANGGNPTLTAAALAIRAVENMNI